jgi:hypothetical protein
VEQGSQAVCGLAARAGMHVLVDGQRERGAGVPSRSETTSTGAPSASGSVACVWRRSCSRITGNWSSPSAFRARLTWVVKRRENAPS